MQNQIQAPKEETPMPDLIDALLTYEPEIVNTYTLEMSPRAFLEMLLDVLDERDAAVIAAVIPVFLGLPFIVSAPVAASSILTVLYDWHRKSKKTIEPDGDQVQILTNLTKKYMPENETDSDTLGNNPAGLLLDGNKHTETIDKNGVVLRLLPFVILFLTMLLNAAMTEDTYSPNLIEGGKMNADFVRMPVEISQNTHFADVDYRNGVIQVPDLSKDNESAPVNENPNIDFDNARIDVQLTYVGRNREFDKQGEEIKPSGYLITTSMNTPNGEMTTYSELESPGIETAVGVPHSRVARDLGIFKDLVNGVGGEYTERLLSHNTVHSVGRVFFDINKSAYYELAGVVATDKEGNKVEVELLELSDGNYAYRLPKGESPKMVSLDVIYLPVEMLPLDASANEFQIRKFGDETPLDRAVRQTFGEHGEDSNTKQVTSEVQEYLDYSLSPYLVTGLEEINLDAFTLRILDIGLAMCSYANVANLTILERLEEQGILDETDPESIIALARGYLVGEGLGTTLNLHMFGYNLKGEIVDATPGLGDTRDEITNRYLLALAQLGVQAQSSEDLRSGLEAQMAKGADQSRPTLPVGVILMLGSIGIIAASVGIAIQKSQILAKDIYDMVDARTEEEKRLVSMAIASIIYSKEGRLKQSLTDRFTKDPFIDYQVYDSRDYYYLVRSHKQEILELVKRYRRNMEELKPESRQEG